MTPARQIRRARVCALAAKVAKHPENAAALAGAAAHLVRCPGNIQRMGADAVNRNRTPAQRSEAGRKAARARWDKRPKVTDFVFAEEVTRLDEISPNMTASDVIGALWKAREPP